MLFFIQMVAQPVLVPISLVDLMVVVALLPLNNQLQRSLKPRNLITIHSHVFHVDHVVVVTRGLGGDPKYSVFGEKHGSVGVINPLVLIEVRVDAEEFVEHPVFVVGGEKVVHVEFEGGLGLQRVFGSKHEWDVF